MSTRKFLLGSGLALSLTTSACVAADRMVGVVPTDGVTMLVKQFEVESGTTITGVQFENNDPATTFPEVLLLHGPLTAVSEGTVLATAASVLQSSPGMVAVTWASPVAATASGTYYVAVCFPKGPGKQGAGHGPALGAYNVGTLTGSYVTCGSERSLLPVTVDLAMSLVTSATSAVGPSKAGDLAPEEPAAVARTFLSVQSRGRSSATIAFGLAQPGNVVIGIYAVSGRLVREIARGSRPAGAYEQSWDGRDGRGVAVAAGVYFVRLQAGKEALMQKLVLTK